MELSEPSETATKLLNSFADTVYKVNLDGVSNRWPEPLLRSTMEGSLYCGSFLLKRFVEVMGKLKKRGYTVEQISNLFIYPSNLLRIQLLFCCKEALQMTRQQQIEIFETTAKLIFPRYKEDPFCIKKTNILLSRDEVQRLEKENLSKKVTPEIRDLLAQIDGKLWLYTEMIFPRWHNLGHEFQGPYKVGEEMLLIKEWHDLKPDNWEFAKLFPYRRILCYEYYRDADVEIDLHNRMDCKKTFKNHLTKFYVQIGDRIITDVAELKEISQQLDLALKEGTTVLSRMTVKDALRHNAEMMFYILKPLADALEEDWRPPKECYEKIASSDLSPTDKKLLQQYTQADPSREGLKRTFSPWFDYED